MSSRQNVAFFFFNVDIVVRASAHKILLSCGPFSTTKFSGSLHARFCVSSCPVWILPPDHVRSMRPSDAGISGLNFEPLSTGKKVANQTSQTSIAALFSAVQTSSSFFSNSAMRSFLIVIYLAFPELQSVWPTSVASFFTNGFHKS